MLGPLPCPKQALEQASAPDENETTHKPDKYGDYWSEL